MDRLFGKELSNLLNPISLTTNTSMISRIPSKSTRQSVIDENHKNINRKP